MPGVSFTELRVANRGWSTRTRVTKCGPERPQEEEEGEHGTRHLGCLVQEGPKPLGHGQHPLPDGEERDYAGGTVAPAKIDEVALSIADMVRPKLVKAGMFLVGLDIVGDKLMEINVFSPGGVGVAEEFEEVDFTSTVMEAMEHKVQYASHCPRGTENAIISML